MKPSKENIVKIYVQFTFILGILLDTLNLLVWIIYVFFEKTLILDTMAYPTPTAETAIVLYFGMGLMLGYIIVLSWGIKQPINRIGILFNISVFIMVFDFLLNYFILVRTIPTYTINVFWMANRQRFIFSAIFFSAWFIGKNMNHQKACLHSTEIKTKGDQISNNTSEFIKQTKDKIKIIYWIGIVLDGLMTILMSLYMLKIDLKFPDLGFPPSSHETVIVISLVNALMLGWTCLLAWGVKKPIERRAVLFITGIFVILPFEIYDLGLILKYGIDIYSAFTMIEMLIIRSVLICLMIYGYKLAQKIAINSESK